MTKTQTLRVKKLLKAVRRRNKKVKNHNFETKTLSKTIPVFEGDTQPIKDEKIVKLQHNKQMRIERGK